MSSIFKHNLKSVPKSKLKLRGRRYKIPNESIRDFGGEHNSVGYRMIQMKLIRQQNKEHAYLMGMLDEIRYKTTGKCACRLCKWIENRQRVRREVRT